MIDKDKLLALYPEHDTVFGPYKRKDNRLHISIENLVIRDKKEHGRLDALYRKEEQVQCSFCNNYFEPTQDQIKTRASLNAGPFCSRKCSGLYGKQVQVSKKVLQRTKIQVNYFRLDK